MKHIDNKLLNIGTVDDVQEVVFRASLADTDQRRYILQATKQSTLSTMERFPKNDIKVTTEHYIDDPDGQWFAFYSVDCFDPPMAIIRAQSFETAYEVFCDEWERWLAVDPLDADDYPEDERHYNSSGTHIDTDNVQGHELYVVSVHC